MNVVLLRVGIDTGSGGIHGPLFADGGFEFVPIPDGFGLDERTYGNTVGSRGRPLIDYFPPTRRATMRDQSMHVDPEFETFTYGDPTVLKSGLRRLQQGDMLLFYCGLKGWDFERPPALHIIGYFAVETAGYARDFPAEELRCRFGRNFHVWHEPVFDQQRDRLVLIKGEAGSRFLKRAALISEVGRTRSGSPLHVLSVPAREIFGTFGGRLSVQRSPPRWVEAPFVERAAAYVRSLP